MKGVIERLSLQEVAQVSNLPYRRFPIGSVPAVQTHGRSRTASRLEALRYSRLGNLRYFLVGSLLVLCLISCAQTPALSFEAANKLYEEGKFAEAAAAYEKLAQSGLVSAALYYNLGNAFFKSGQIGRAIAAYHQGEKITPRDPDIRANLQFARNQVQGPTLVPTRSHRWLGRLTLNEWSLLAAGAIWLWLLLLALLQWRPALRPSLRGLVVVLTLTALLFCACLAGAWSDRHSTQTVVVVAPDAVVHNGPFEESPTAFHLNDGAELRVLDEQHDWLQVTADGRRSGWLRKDKVVSVS